MSDQLARLKNGGIELTIRGGDGAMCLTSLSCGVAFEQRPSGMTIDHLRQGDGEITFSLNGPGMSVCCRLSLGADYAQLEIIGDGAMDELAFPGPWRMRPEDLCLYPMGSGVCFSAGDGTFAIPERMEAVWGAGWSMTMWGVQRGESVLMNVLEKCVDASLHTVRRDGFTESGVVWLSQKGEWGYPRVMRFYLGDSLSAVCASIRLWRQQAGYVKTLKEKMAHTPGLWKLLGAADIWLWDDNNMNRLYARPEVPEKTTRDVRRIAGEMKAMGFDRVIWNSFEGETPEDCLFLKEQGWLVGKYDIYRDVIPGDARAHVIPYRLKRGEHHFKNWPDDVRIERDGSLALAWQLHTTDGTMCYQNAICDMCALKMTMEDVPPDVGRVGYNARFIDVQGGSPGRECWNPLHPCTRADSLRYVRLQTEYLGDLGLVAGVEAVHEGVVSAVHFSEGTLSPFIFRAEDAGRRMNTLYYGDGIPRQISHGMLHAACRVPLWELIYHDCAVSYWYWGDSSNCCPELMDRRDLFDALYGCPPLYSLSASQWEALRGQIARSYHRATETARKVALMPMTRFEWLTPDRMVQRTEFGGRYIVTANFSAEAFTLEDGSELAPGEYRMEE